MNCVELADRVQRFQPQASPIDVARLCLLLYNFIQDESDLRDDEKLFQSCKELSIRLQAATDQQAAMTNELQQLAKSDPKKFTPDQIWILVRAVNVQSQVMQLYCGAPSYEMN